jgi:hypothetical protein
MKLLLFSLSLSLCSCQINPTQKGTVTMTDNGVTDLTKKGDRLLETGIYARRDVPPGFAEGYAKGQADQVKREWEDLQNQQRYLHFWSVLRRP